MIKDTNTTITRYVYWDRRVAHLARAWYVDIIETNHIGGSEEMFEAWLTCGFRGDSSYMFGVPKVQPSTGEVMTHAKFVDMVESNVDEYIDDYNEEDYCNV